jgi:transposase
MGRVRKKYPREFKIEAVKLMLKGDCTNSELARRLNVRESDLRDWRKQYEKNKDDSFPGQDSQRQGL